MWSRTIDTSRSAQKMFHHTGQCPVGVTDSRATVRETPATTDQKREQIMQSVTCRTCGNRVLAEKNGTFHTFRLNPSVCEPPHLP